MRFGKHRQVARCDIGAHAETDGDELRVGVERAQVIHHRFDLFRPTLTKDEFRAL